MKVSGASAGAVAAVAMLSDVPLGSQIKISKKNCSKSYQIEKHANIVSSICILQIVSLKTV
jgi:hypothetical protein